MPLRVLAGTQRFVYDLYMGPRYETSVRRIKLLLLVMLAMGTLLPIVVLAVPFVIEPFEIENVLVFWTLALLLAMSPPAFWRTYAFVEERELRWELDAQERGEWPKIE